MVEREARQAAGDVELVRRALGRDRGACERLAERLTCVPRMLAVLNRRLGAGLTHHDLEDLAQDTLIALWPKLRRFVGPSTLEAWCYRFCFGQYMNRLRAKGVERGLVETSQALVSERPAETAEPLTPRFEREVERALMELPLELATVIMSKHFGGLTFKEIAEELDVPQNTAKSHYYRGLARMRDRLRHLWEELAS